MDGGDGLFHCRKKMILPEFNRKVGTVKHFHHRFVDAAHRYVDTGASDPVHQQRQGFLTGRIDVVDSVGDDDNVFEIFS
jgi:hypothetical protein